MSLTVSFDGAWVFISRLFIRDGSESEKRREELMMSERKRKRE